MSKLYDGDVVAWALEQVAAPLLVRKCRMDLDINQLACIAAACTTGAFEPYFERAGASR
ncbi:hypothetical protein HHL21_04875 [Massilia sp. RP-1-19]|uniref:Uncharacterized protein n=1 Tax=Massilia polaris TaxID=2728846 RepID=A0A848HHG6_9BURK|nr:hypothetical protein [Massilia polaris]NML60432.1 hypothetical protein [Massilia polaris]